MERERDPFGVPFVPGAGTHVPPDGADWTEHRAGSDCLHHLELAARGEVPWGGHIRAPSWRERLADRPPMADWYRRRHHCSDAVLGSHWHAAQYGEDDQLPF